jgi:uncharacterized protein (DUF1778 family)
LEANTTGSIVLQKKSCDNRCLLDVYGFLPYNIIRRCIMRSTTTSTARLEARISKELHATLKRAAELQNRTITDFVIDAVQEAAKKTIEQTEVLRLSLADQECFAHALLSPPKPTPALKRAFTSHRKLLSAE